MRRVVITGMGMYSPLGVTAEEVLTNLHSLHNATEIWDELGEYHNMTTRLCCKVKAPLPNYPRRKARSMGRIGRLATAATELALADANLTNSTELTDGSCGIAYGSSGGSAEAMLDVGAFINDHDVVHLNATTYTSIMPHTVAVNLSIYFGIHGRIIATSTACTSGSQAIGYAAEAIRAGSMDLMVAGGAEELSAFSIAVFDALFATSQSNDNPQSAPRPFDAKRDGIVVGEGAGTLILEEYEHAKQRGAKIYAEIVGFGTNCDATHLTNPSSADMEKCMQLALKNASLTVDDIGYINAHGTGTLNGDLAEGNAMSRLFADKVPVSTLKSYMGHTLGAAGALEAIMSIYMQRAQWFAPNLNLQAKDPAIGPLQLITGAGLTKNCQYIMSNNFAFGGVNTSLIFKSAE